MSVICLPKRHAVGMGVALVVRAPEELGAVLGSCVGVALFHPRLRVAGLAHVMLPESKGHANGPPGKFADTAIPCLLEQFLALGVPTAGLVAKIAGGANMFATQGPLQIGDMNIAAVEVALEQARLRLVARHLGGEKGRRVVLNSETGELRVEIAGQLPQTL